MSIQREKVDDLANGREPSTDPKAVFVDVVMVCVRLSVDPYFKQPKPTTDQQNAWRCLPIKTAVCTCATCENCCTCEIGFSFYHRVRWFGTIPSTSEREVTYYQFFGLDARYDHVRRFADSIRDQTKPDMTEEWRADGRLCVVLRPTHKDEDVSASTSRILTAHSTTLEYLFPWLEDIDVVAKTGRVKLLLFQEPNMSICEPDESEHATLWFAGLSYLFMERPEAVTWWGSCVSVCRLIFFAAT
ncbi:Hypothetical protein UVM_LOCUS379 [uncultured virus]|nr:Hypothetical protein UVM_LOCUS379 [uncultured virus]